MSSYSKINIRTVDNVSSNPQRQARFLSKPLGLQLSGMSMQRYEPGFRTEFGHKHSVQEEIIVILGGSGFIKLDEAIVEVSEWDAIRVAPGVMQAIEAGSEGLEFLIFGAPKTAERDFEMVQDWWTD